MALKSEWFAMYDLSSLILNYQVLQHFSSTVLLLLLLPDYCQLFSVYHRVALVYHALSLYHFFLRAGHYYIKVPLFPPFFTYPDLLPSKLRSLMTNYPAFPSPSPFCYRFCSSLPTFLIHFLSHSSSQYFMTYQIALFSVPWLYPSQCQRIILIAYLFHVIKFLFSLHYLLRYTQQTP